jgi:RimJ/RimL family protein N-acetyltransferase
MDRHFGEYALRDWREEDAPSVAKYADNRKIWRCLRDLFPHPYRLEHAQEFIRRARAAAPPTLFAIATHTEAIGSIGLSLGQDVHRYTAELGYWLAEPYWGKGIMTQAVQAMVEYAFGGCGPARSKMAASWISSCTRS